MGFLKSNTVRGIALMAAAWYLEKRGVIAPGSTSGSGMSIPPEILDLIKAIGVVWATYGGRNLMLKMAAAAATGQVPK